MNIVCVHGSGSCREAWHYQTAAFANITAVNLPGHPDGELIPTIGGMVEWLHGYIAEAGLAPVVLFGHSLGAGVVMQYALDYGDAVSGLVLVGAGARLKVSPAILEGLARDIQTGSAWDPMTGYERIAPEVAAVLARRRVENGPHARLNDLSACNDFDIIANLSNITIPTLAICGTDDAMTPPKYTQFLAARLPDARGVVIEGGTHQVHLEKPDEVNQEIRAFLDDRANGD
jgi:pimeloyl-ACP methyl ester carboxylesterase